MSWLSWFEHRPNHSSAIELQKADWDQNAMLISDDACTLYLGSHLHIPLVEFIAGMCSPDFVDVDFDGVLPARLVLV